MEFSKEVLVYPSNNNGTYKKGIANHAKSQWGAKFGVANAFDGDSAYAISTRDERNIVIGFRQLKNNIDQLIKVAEKNKGTLFKVPRFHGFNDEDVAPMFALAPKNIQLSRRYKSYILDQEDRLWWSV